jgi:hypothetical protein
MSSGSIPRHYYFSQGSTVIKEYKRQDDVDLYGMDEG